MTDNMIATAKLRYLRIAPRKVRMVADLIRGKRVTEAQKILHFLPKKASLPLVKLLKSAAASAKNNHQLEEISLYISKITVDEGPKLKRWRARARGQAYEIQKKTSHINIALDAIDKKPKKQKRKRKEETSLGRAGKIERKPKAEKPRFRTEKEQPKPKFGRGIRRIFRRKAF